MSHLVAVPCHSHLSPATLSLEGAPSAPSPPLLSLSAIQTADPENATYDALRLRKGWNRTFFRVETPFAIKDRIEADGAADLCEILPRWKPCTRACAVPEPLGRSPLRARRLSSGPPL